MRAAAFRLILAVAVAAGVAGCGSDSKNPVAPVAETSLFTGLFVNGFTAGKITVTISGASASATLTFGNGSSASLLGTFSQENDSLHVTGSDHILIGHYDDTVVPPSITGSFTSLAGEGIFGCFRDSTGTIKVYCGSYVSSSTPAIGSWNFVTIDTVVAGVAFPQGGTPNDLIAFTGTVTGTGAGRAIEFTGGDPGVLDLTGTGTLTTATGAVNGDWALDDASNVADDAGTWEGALCP